MTSTPALRKSAIFVNGTKYPMCAAWGDESLAKVQKTENIRRPVGVVPIEGRVSQSLRSRVGNDVRTPVGFGRSALGINTFNDITSKNFLKSASDQVVFFRYLFF